VLQNTLFTLTGYETMAINWCSNTTWIWENISENCIIQGSQTKATSY